MGERAGCPVAKEPPNRTVCKKRAFPENNCGLRPTGQWFTQKKEVRRIVDGLFYVCLVWVVRNLKRTNRPVGSIAGRCSMYFKLWLWRHVGIRKAGMDACGEIQGATTRCQKVNNSLVCVFSSRWARAQASQRVHVLET